MALWKVVYTETQQAVFTVRYIPVWLYYQKGVKLHVCIYYFLSKFERWLWEVYDLP